MKSGRLRRPKDEFVVRTPPDPLKDGPQPGVERFGKLSVIFGAEFLFLMNFTGGAARQRRED